MEEKTNVVVKEENIGNPQQKPVVSRQQSILYTILSIGLFCIIYFGGKGIINNLNRSYYMIQSPDNISNELLSLQYEYSSIAESYGLVYEGSRLEKTKNGYKVSILFSGIEDEEDFIENGIGFEFGDAVENTENEIYPYTENPNLAEYVTCVKYVNNDDLNSEILVFEYDDTVYAEYQGYGYIVPTDVKILFDGCEKVY